MIAGPISGVFDTALDLRDILHKSPVRMYIDQVGFLSGWVRRYSRLNWRCFFMRATSSSIRVVRSALSALDSPISGGFRSCALKYRSSSSLGESYSSQTDDSSCVIVSLRFWVCSSVEETWEGSSPDSGLLGTSFSFFVITVHSWMFSEVGLNVSCPTGFSIQGTASLAIWSGVPGMVMKKFNFRLVVRFVPLGCGGFVGMKGSSSWPFCFCVLRIARMSLALRCVMRL